MRNLRIDICSACTSFFEEGHFCQHWLSLAVLMSDILAGVRPNLKKKDIIYISLMGKDVE